VNGKKNSAAPRGLRRPLHGSSLTTSLITNWKTHPGSLFTRGRFHVQTDSSHSKTHELGSIIVSMEPIDSLLWNHFLNCLQLLHRTLRNQKFESSPSCLSKLVPLLLTYLTSLIAMTIVFPSTSPLVLVMFPSCCPSSGLTLNQE